MHTWAECGSSTLTVTKPSNVRLRIYRRAIITVPVGDGGVQGDKLHKALRSARHTEHSTNGALVTITAQPTLKLLLGPL